MNTITKTFSVDPGEVELVQERLDKLNKKAIKLGISPAKIVRQVEYFVIINEYTLKRIPKIELTVQGEEIKFADYELIASLDHTVGSLPIVKVVPDKLLPEQYQTADCACDHCGIKRNRSNTYVFKDDNGFKQVGSSCLKEFFGIDPTQSLNWFNSFYQIDDEFVRGSRSYYEAVHSIITFGLAVVEDKGYISKKAAQAYNEIESTGDLVLQALNPPISTKDNRDHIEWCRNIAKRASELESDADNMIAWGVEYFAKQSGEYAHNMGIFLNASSVKPSYVGYVVSVIGAWQRENVAKLERESKRFDNEYLGNVGDKITVDVNVIKVIPLEGNYGTSYMNIMNQVDTGNNVIWVSSNKVLDEGTKVTLKGTVKKLNNREGKNQTFITRAKVI